MLILQIRSQKLHFETAWITAGAAACKWNVLVDFVAVNFKWNNFLFLSHCYQTDNRSTKSREHDFHFYFFLGFFSFLSLAKIFVWLVPFAPYLLLFIFNCISCFIFFFFSETVTLVLVKKETQAQSGESRADRPCIRWNCLFQAFYWCFCSTKPSQHLEAAEWASKLKERTSTMMHSTIQSQIMTPCLLEIILKYR